MQLDSRSKACLSLRMYPGTVLVLPTDSVADPDLGPGAFLTPGSGFEIRNKFFFRITDPTHDLVIIVRVKNTEVLCPLTQIFFYTC
jgi:hypothetical protein